MWPVRPALRPTRNARHSTPLPAALDNDACGDGPESFRGDPTGIAPLVAAQAAGLSKDLVQREFPRVAELPFDSARKMMTTVHRLGAEHIALVKGAPEQVLERCVHLCGTHSAFARGEAPQLAARRAADGLRVIAFACRRFEYPPAARTSAALEPGLEFLGLFGLIDPPRPEAANRCACARTPESRR